MLAMLPETYPWHGRTVRWARAGSGPALVLCHGTPWSSALWRPFAERLAERFTTYVWDMPGYGGSSKEPDHDVSLATQSDLFADLLGHWGLVAPHVAAHDIGGAVALRAHLLRGVDYASLALVDVVALAPWGSDFFRLVRDHVDVFERLPPAIHEAVVRAYVAGASAAGLSDSDLAALAAPWLGEAGQRAFYRQMAQVVQRDTDEIEPHYGEVRSPTMVIWGAEDAWIPLERGRRLAELIPGAGLEVIPGAGHLVHLDRPDALAEALHRWLG